MRELSGICVPICTPFDQTGERLDETALRNHIDSMLQAGVHIVLVCGGAGEFAYLRAAEKRRIAEIAARHIDGRAAFMLLDASMSIVAEGEEDLAEGELCMADCCASELLECTTLVKVVDEQGQLVPIDSRKLLGLKESDLVVIQGTAKKDENGNFVMLAKGVYIRN